MIYGIKDYLNKGININKLMDEQNSQFGKTSGSIDYLKFVIKFLTDPELVKESEEWHAKTKGKAETGFTYFKSEPMWCDALLLKFVKENGGGNYLLDDGAVFDYDTKWIIPHNEMVTRVVKFANNLKDKDYEWVTKNQGSYFRKNPAWGDLYKDETSFKNKRMAKIIRRLMMPFCTKFHCPKGRFKIRLEDLDDKCIAKLTDADGILHFPKDGVEYWRFPTDSERFKISFGYENGDTTKLHTVNLAGESSHMASSGGTGMGKSVSLTAYLLLMCLAYSPSMLAVTYLDAKAADSAVMAGFNPPTFKLIAPTKSVSYAVSALADIGQDYYARNNLASSIGLLTMVEVYATCGLSVPRAHFLIDEVAALIECGAPKETVKELRGLLNNMYMVGRNGAVSTHWFTQVVPVPFKGRDAESGLVWGNIRVGASLGSDPESSKQIFNSTASSDVNTRGIMVVSPNAYDNTVPNVRVKVPLAVSWTDPVEPNHLALFSKMMLDEWKKFSPKRGRVFMESRPVTSKELDDFFVKETKTVGEPRDLLPIGLKSKYNNEKVYSCINLSNRDRDHIMFLYKNDDQYEQFFRMLFSNIKRSCNADPDSYGNVVMYSAGEDMEKRMRKIAQPYLADCSFYSPVRNHKIIKSLGDPQLVKVVDTLANIADTRKTVLVVDGYFAKVLSNDSRVSKDTILESILDESIIDEYAEIVSSCINYQVEEEGGTYISDVFRSSRLMESRCIYFIDWFLNTVVEKEKLANGTIEFTSRATGLQEVVEDFVSIKYKGEEDVVDFAYKDLSPTGKKFLEFLNKEELDKALEREIERVANHNNKVVKRTVIRAGISSSKKDNGDNRISENLERATESVMSNKRLSLKEISVIYFLIYLFSVYEDVDKFDELVKYPDFKYFYIIIDGLEYMETSRKQDLDTLKYLNFLKDISDFSLGNIRIIFTTNLSSAINKETSSYLGHYYMFDTADNNERFAKGVSIPFETIVKNVSNAGVLVTRKASFEVEEFIPASYID